MEAEAEAELPLVCSDANTSKRASGEEPVALSPLAAAPTAEEKPAMGRASYGRMRCSHGRAVQRCGWRAQLACQS